MLMEVFEVVFALLFAVTFTSLVSLAVVFAVTFDTAEVLAVTFDEVFAEMFAVALEEELAIT